MNIALDMMGGDFAPDEAIKGISSYIAQGYEGTVTLIGTAGELNSLLQTASLSQNEQIRVVPSTQVIGMHEHPTKALKEKTDSSIAIGFHLLASGKTDAFISAGNTGAMLVGALFSIKAIEGVLRPTISTIIPKDNGKTGLLLDVGLNADCKPEHLNQFATLGSVYAKHMLGIEKPRVALLNVGEEEGKGNLLAQGTYPLLKTNPHIHFTGNVEGRDILLDKADVVVAEGFTGNVILKMAESLYEIAEKNQMMNDYFDRFNFEHYGGTPVLGVNKPVIIGHGISRARAFHNMLAVAEKMISTDLMAKMRAEID